MLRRLLFALSLLLLAGLLALAWYVSDKGFTRKWRSYIIAEFREAGVEVQIKRLTLDPFRGLVAREVSVLDARNRKRVIAWVDEMLLGVNYASAFRGENFLDSADLRDANLWLPLDPRDPDGPRFEITKLNARLFLPPKQIYLARAQAEMYGIQLYASGRLINPQALKAQPSAPSPAADLGARIVKELSKLKYGAPPVLTCEFTGDLAQPEQIQVDLHFSAREIRRKKYELRAVDLVAGLRSGVLEVQHLSASDPQGELRATGSYDLATREVDGRVSSGLHLAELERAFRWFPHPEHWVLTDPPDLDFRIDGRLGPESTLRVAGHAELRRSAYQKITFHRLSTDFAWQRDAWTLRDFYMAQADGDLTGDVICRPSEFRARLTSTLQPKVISHLLAPEHAEWLGRFSFETAPTLSLDLHGTDARPEACSGTGRLTFQQLRYQGRPVAPASSTLDFKEQVLRLTPFVLEKEPSPAPAQLVIDLARHEVRHEEVPPAATEPAPVPAPSEPLAAE